MKTKQILFFAASVLIIFALFTSSCKKKDNDNDDDNDPTPQNNAGLGDNPGFPTGTAFHLPSGITIIDQIRGGEFFGKNHIPINKLSKQLPVNKDINAFWEYYGSGTYVDLYIQFYNTLTIDTSIIIPGGLIFIDSSGVYQNGFVLQSLTIPLIASDTAFAIVRAYCCNLSKHVSDWEAIYTFGPVSNNTELVKIVNILKTKQIPDISNYTVTGEIQSILWDITDYNQVLTQDQLNFLNSLP